MLTEDNAIDSPTRSVLAFNEKWVSPPPGSGFWPVQRKASRNEGASAASTPSILRDGWLLMTPSNASLSGAPPTRNFRPERSPVSAARKLLTLMLPSTGLSRHTKCPVAAKLLEIEGHASEISASV